MCGDDGTDGGSVGDGKTGADADAFSATHCCNNKLSIHLPDPSTNR